MPSGKQNMNVQCHNISKIISKTNETNELEAHSGKFLIVCPQCKKETTYNQVANKRKLILIQCYNKYMGKQSGFVEYNNALTEK